MTDARARPSDAIRFIAVFHRKERRSKCTLEPLLDRPEFTVRVFPDLDGVDWSSTSLLAPDGQPLSHEDRGRPLVLVDGTWRYASRMVSSIPAPRRSLLGFITAYPRTSKLFRDPAGGLASVEAVFAAMLLLGRYDPEVLDSYRWGDEFLEINRRRINDLRNPGVSGLSEAQTQLPGEEIP